MSDYSGYSHSESEPEQDGSDHDSDGHGRDSWEEEEDSRSDASEDHDDTDAAPILDFKNLELCPQHKAGDMTKDCSKCKAALGLINDDNTVKLLTLNSTKSNLISRYAGRCDDIVPTMSLHEATHCGGYEEHLYQRNVQRQEKVVGNS